MNKIVSRFYLIRLDGEPVYVGYTNRTIKQRFSEHKHDKDFGNANSTVENLGKLEYNFTWNRGLINQYAKEVSDKETDLVEEYGTQDSVWQKGLGSISGGQTWADIKYFVKTNRENPVFKDVNEETILKYLDTSDKVSRYLSGFVKTMNDPVTIYMANFVGNMNTPVVIYINHFVSHMDDPVAIYISDFVGHIDNPINMYMKHFVSHMNDPVSIYMGSFVSNMNNDIVIYMNSFVAHMNKNTVYN